MFYLYGLDYGDTSLGGTLRGAVKGTGISMPRKWQDKLTSSRDKACLNTLIVVFTSTKGNVLREIIPTLATVSLSIDRTPIKVRCHDSEHPPDTKKVDGYGATERLLEPQRKGFVSFAGGLEQSVRKRDLLCVIFGEQADLHS
jgi:hypothetical protein